MKKILFTFISLSFAVFVQAQVQLKAGDIKPLNNNIAKLNTAVINYDFSKVKICVDKKPSATGTLPPRQTTAGAPIPKINSDGTISQVGVIQQGLTSANDKMWNPGENITVYLNTNNGSQLIRDKVTFYAHEWEKYANVKFVFVNSFRDAKIKVGFFPTNESWSWVGRDVLFNPLGLYTMNFGWFDGSTVEAEFSRVIMHEFGHALGFLHEHQSPVSPLQFDLPKTYQFFKERDGWDAATVNDQIINKYTQGSTNFSAYDMYSIMHYMIPQELLIAGSGRDFQITYPSGTDTRYAGYWYPFPPKGVNTQGNLRTNDDCDDIAFKVEYNAGGVPPDMVEFTLQLSELNGKKVTWWKQIGIPRTNNSETNLWVQNHSLIASENRTTVTMQIPINEINTAKGISFWKAKILGVHTLLDYKWNVLTAIKGGCRVTLLWDKDTCAN